MAELASKFIEALEELHSNRDVEPLLELFGDDATLSKAGIPHDRHGRDGARTFWQDYRDVFDAVEATFQHTVTDDDVVFLEWKSTGTLRDGTDFRYDGVSVLEGDGDTITAFRTYYDTAAFLNVERRLTS
jgi:ketosteroid isomerase-like protein